MKMELKDKVVIVTGSSGGIGWGIAKAAHAAGASVLLHGSRVDALEVNTAALGDNADWIAADLTHPASPQRIVHKALERFGRLDGLVNNAGIFPRNDLSNVTVEDYERIFAVISRALRTTHRFDAIRELVLDRPGTPPGVGLGFKPPRYLVAGDAMRLGIEGLGEQNQTCVADD